MNSGQREDPEGIGRGRRWEEGVLRSSSDQLHSRSLYLGWARGTEGKGDITSGAFCKAEIQARPLTLECHSEAH